MPDRVQRWPTIRACCSPDLKDLACDALAGSPTMPAAAGAPVRPYLQDQRDRYPAPPAGATRRPAGIFFGEPAIRRHLMQNDFPAYGVISILDATTLHHSHKDLRGLPVVLLSELMEACQNACVMPGTTLVFAWREAPAVRQRKACWKITRVVRWIRSGVGVFFIAVPQRRAQRGVIRSARHIGCVHSMHCAPSPSRTTRGESKAAAGIPRRTGI